MSRLRELGDAATRVGYRDVFIMPNLGTMLDIERTVLYLATMAATLAIAELPHVIVPLLVLCAIGLGFSGSRLVRRMDPIPLPSMVVDLALVAAMAPIALPQPWAGLILTAFLGVEFILLDITLSRYTPVIVLTGIPHVLVSLVALPPAASLAIRIAASSLIIGVSMVVLVVYAARSKEIRRQLVATELKLSALVATAPVSIGTVSPAGLVTSWTGNEALEFDEDPLRRSHREAFSGMPGLSDLIDAAARSGTQRGELSRDGRSFQVTATPLGRGPVKEVAVVAFDVSEQVAARRRLEDIVTEKDQFIATVSHELRTPLTAIVGFGESLEAMLATRNEPELMELASILTQQGRNMSFMVEDLLVAARSEMGRIKVRQEEVDLAVTAEEATAAIAGQMDGRTPALSLDACPATGDPVRIGQIVRNLLTNAARYGGSEVRVSTRHRNGWATIEVADNGPPIPEDEREQIFQPYERSSTRPAHPQSIGLGLSVCRKLARTMGGDVTYHHDGWSRFVVSLPTSTVDQAAGHRPSQSVA